MTRLFGPPSLLILVYSSINAALEFVALFHEIEATISEFSIATLSAECIALLNPPLPTYVLPLLYNISYDPVAFRISLVLFAAL